jgi:hypothetical protein
MALKLLLVLLNQYPLKMIYLMLDYLRSEITVFFVLRFEVTVKIIDLDFFVTGAWSDSTQRQAAFLRLILT